MNLKSLLVALLRNITRHWWLNSPRVKILARLPGVPIDYGPVRLRSGDLLASYYFGRTDYVSRCLFWFGDFEPWVVTLIRSFAQRGDTVVDIGANIGVMTLVAARKVGADGRVISIEPMPEHARKLKENIIANGFDNVTFIEAAVSDHVGSVVMAIPNNQEGHARVVEGESGHHVQCVHLDGLLKGAGVSAVALCKIDVEGHETAVIEGAMSSINEGRIKSWIIERNASSMDDSFWKIFIDANYCIWRIWKSPARFYLVGPGQKGKGRPTNDYLLLHRTVPRQTVVRWLVHG